MASTTTPTQPLGQPPSMPYFINAFDRGTFEAYLRSRASSFLQRQYKLLLSLPEGEEYPPYVNPYKRAREEAPAEEAGQSGTEAGSPHKRARSQQSGAQLPHIDSAFMLELTTVKPEAGVLAVGDAPDDVYLPALPKGKRDDHRALIGALIDRTVESDTLFWDLKRLNHAQVKALAETEWSRQLPVVTRGEREKEGEKAQGLAAGAGQGSTRSSRRQAAAQQSQQQQLAQENSHLEEREIEEEMASIRRAFCDKTRAQALAARAAQGW